MKIAETIVGAVTEFLTGLGQGVSTAFSNLFLTEANALNPLAITILTMAGIGIAMGLFAWIKSIIHK